MSTTITVEGMSCEHCEQTVEEAVRDVSGVSTVTADHESERAVIEGDVAVSEVVSAVEDAGYTARA